MVKDAITAATYDKLDAIYKLLIELLGLEDSFAVERVASTVRDLLAIFEDKKKLPKSTETNLDFLINILYERNRHAKEYLDHLYRTTAGTTNDALEWIEQWLLRFVIVVILISTLTLNTCINRHRAQYGGSYRTPGWLLQELPQQTEAAIA